MASETLSTNVPHDLVAELRATSARTGIPMARIVRDGLRMRLDQLKPTPPAPAPTVYVSGAAGQRSEAFAAFVRDQIAAAIEPTPGAS